MNNNSNNNMHNNMHNNSNNKTIINNKNNIAMANKKIRTRKRSRKNLSNNTNNTKVRPAKKIKTLSDKELLLTPNSALLDFWKSLWHVDVFKDHGSDYDANIINEFLFDNEYTTTLALPGKNPIAIAGQLANRTLRNNVIYYSDLFSYLTNGIEYADLSKLNVGDTKEIQLNSIIMGPDVNYIIKVFDSEGLHLSDFVDDTVILYVDTSSHLPELITNFNNNQNKKVMYANTREIQSDAADKITFQTIGEQNRISFYYELSSPNNPTTIQFSPYENNNGLSYFYCKYPIFLRNNGPNDLFTTRQSKKKYNLDVELSYKKGDKNIIVKDGVNTAGAMQKFKDGFKKILGINPEDITKETVFISKHHGDVAQSLVQFRNVKIKCPVNNQIINTNDFKSVFVSIDVNAIIKALTIQTPYIFMYTPDKRRIVVWKNQSTSSPENRYNSLKSSVSNQASILLNKCKQYNENILSINNIKNQFDNIIEQYFVVQTPYSESTLEQVINTYKALLEVGIRITTLSRFVPTETLEPLVESNFDFNNKIHTANIVNNIETNIQILKNIQKEINDKYLEFKIPIDYTTIKVVHNAINTDTTLVETSIEKDIVLSFAEGRTGWTCLSDDKGKILDMWEYITLDSDSKELNRKHRRFGPKLNTTWGMDLIHHIYIGLQKYKSIYATLFIKKLYSIIYTLQNNVPDKQKKLDIFIFGLSFCGITFTLEHSGGGKLTKRVYKPSQVLYQQPLYIPVTVHKPELTFNYFEEFDSALTDIEAHLEAMLYINYLYSLRDKITTKHYKEIGYIILDNFFQIVFSNTYIIDSNFRRKWKSQFQLYILSKRTIGGGIQYNTFLYFIQYLLGNLPILSNIFPTSSNTRLRDVKTLDIVDTINFYTTYSVINYYESIVNEQYSIDTRLEYYKKLRNSTERQQTKLNLSNKLYKIRKLLHLLKNTNSIINDEPIAEVSLGGRKIQYKTFKKSKSLKRKL